MTRKSFSAANSKGQLGERIVKGILERKGFIVYRPETDGSHAFDILAIKDKRRCIAIDVKAKARRTAFPDTGINQRHFEVYQQFSLRHLMPFWLFFVDESMLEIYGNTLDELEKPRTVAGRKYPMVSKTAFGVDIRYWPLEAMIKIDNLNCSQTIDLMQMSQRSYEYHG